MTLPDLRFIIPERVVVTGATPEVRFVDTRARPLGHSVRYANGCCVDCWAKIKPGPPAILVADDVPHTATTTGGV